MGLNSILFKARGYNWEMRLVVFVIGHLLRSCNMPHVKIDHCQWPASFINEY